MSDVTAGRSDAATASLATNPRSLRLLAALVSLSVVALVVRLLAAERVGYGDSEALYASYALFPQPAYLDHPGLVGILARALGHGLAPAPQAAHELTAVAMTLAPWAVVLTGRLLGASARASLGAGLATAVAPEIAVGLFGMTPDLLLFFAWLATLALFGRALRSPPGSTLAAALFMAAGLALGVACTSKVSGLTLGLALAVTLLAGPVRAHARTVWPWTTLVLAGVVFLPVVVYEARLGWPMLRHRLVDTQHDARVSLRNLLAVVLGQAVYVSPLLFASGIVLGRELLTARRRDVVSTLLAAAVAVPLVVLGALCLWSRVAEPHWLAPVWLPIPLYYAWKTTEEDDADGLPRTRPHPLLGARARTAALALGLASSALVYAWVLLPGLVALVPRGAYDARLDLANELYGWPEVAADVRRAIEEERVPLTEPGDIVVVGSVWMVAAQLRAALPADVPVGCVGPNAADFLTWNPPTRWARAELVVLVYDNRAPADSPSLFPDRALLTSHTHRIVRGGQVARVFTIEVLSRRGAG